MRSTTWSRHVRDTLAAVQVRQIGRHVVAVGELACQRVAANREVDVGHRGPGAGLVTHRRACPRHRERRTAPEDDEPGVICERLRASVSDAGSRAPPPGLSRARRGGPLTVDVSDVPDDPPFTSAFA